MSYQKFIKDTAKEYKVPYSIWRDMNNIMSGVAIMSHYLDNTQIAKMMRDRGWDKEQLAEMRRVGEDMNLVIQVVMFRSACEIEGVDDEYIHQFLRFWQNL